MSQTADHFMFENRLELGKNTNELKFWSFKRTFFERVELPSFLEDNWRTIWSILSGIIYIFLIPIR